MTKSRLRSKLRAGGFVKVVGINRVTEPWLAEVAGKLGFDVIWFDMEHRAHGYEIVDRMAVACRATDIDLMVRIRKTGYTSAMRALEFGANGIMVPHCCSVEEAQQWANWTRFPPQGTRGFDGAGADGDYSLSDPLEYLRERNEETFLAVQIEDTGSDRLRGRDCGSRGRRSVVCRARGSEHKLRCPHATPASPGTARFGQSSQCCREGWEMVGDGD